MLIQGFLIVDPLDDRVISLFLSSVGDGSILRWREECSDFSLIHVFEVNSRDEYRHRRIQCLGLECHSLRN